MFNKLMVYYKEVKRRIVSINWDNTWEEEELFLNKLIKERSQKGSSGLYDSLYQYKAQTFKVKFRQKLILQIITFFSFGYVVLKAMSNFNKVNGAHADVVHFYDNSIFPRSMSQHKKLVFISSSNLKLKFEDILNLLNVILKTRFNFIIVSSYAFRIAQIRYAIDNCGVSEVWTNMEYSCSSGLVFEYCKKKDILFKNFMHGEKVLTLRDTFGRFNECIVWSEHHKIIFEKLHCTANKIICNPWNLNNKKSDNKKSKQVCYFLKGIESKKEIEIINTNLKRLAANGYEIFYKPHPRQMNFYKLDSTFKEFDDFINNDISSLYQFDYVIAEFSTVLFQCYCSNQKIIINDVSNIKMFNDLKDRNYIFSDFDGDNILKLGDVAL